jgi:predicted regulator of Ras-like GTPase activity (Roadblock/LC7/MglB family)
MSVLREAQRQRVERVLRGLVTACPGVIVATVANKEAVTLACAPNDPLADAVSRSATALCALAEGAALELDGGTVSQVMVRAERAHLVAQWVPPNALLAVLCSSKTALGGIIVEVAAAARELAGVV